MVLTTNGSQSHSYFRLSIRLWPKTNKEQNRDHAYAYKVFFLVDGKKGYGSSILKMSSASYLAEDARNFGEKLWSPRARTMAFIVFIVLYIPTLLTKFFERVSL